MITSLFNALVYLGSEWVMWILLFLSLASTAVIAERFRFLRKQDQLGSLFWKEHVEHWMQAGIPPKAELMQIALLYPCLESDLMNRILLRMQNSREDQLLFMSSFLGRSKIELDRHLSFLGTLGANAPFIGLFGTVLGIIQAFRTLGQNTGDSAGMGSVGGGLSEALVATAVGLFVAIPSVMAFNYFQRKIRMILQRTESLGQFVISSALERESHGGY